MSSVQKKYFIFLAIWAVALFLRFNLNERHYEVEENGGKQLYVAWHIDLPGFATTYYPEQTIDLREWVGTSYFDLKAVNKSDQSVNAEATAGLALKAMGVYGADYEMIEKDGHYYLHRPEKKEDYFSWQAHYQVWPGQKTNG